MGELVSTRDPSQTTFGYSESVLQGLAPDGGLLVPKNGYPKLSTGDLYGLSTASYVDIFRFIKSRFVGSDDPLAGNVQGIAEQAYSPDNFPNSENGNVTPVRHITGSHYLQDLSDGPTAAFKDMALQPLAQEMNHILMSRGERLTLLGATSGDTGSAAEAAVKGLGTLSLIMLSPTEGMSEFQKAQMGVLSGGNIHNISIPGPFDDCQDLVKEINKDQEFADIGAVNSINWGRIVSQVPYYVSGYLQTIKMSDGSIGEPVDFVVPSGNFGNILAGYIARSMGVPIRRLVVATNENNVLHRLVQRGEYQFAQTTPTSSPSMDISKASNFERLLYDMMEGDAERVSTFMERFNREGSASLQDFGLSVRSLLDLGFDSGSSTHHDRLMSIQWVYKRSGVVIDPHTADAVTVAQDKYQGDGVPVVTMSTAKPVKFENTIKEALGHVPEREDRFTGIEVRGSSGFVDLPISVSALKQYIRNHR